MRERPLRVGRETVRKLLKENMGDVQISNDFLDCYTAYLKVLLRARIKMIVKQHSERLEKALKEMNDANGIQGKWQGKRITTKIGNEVLEIDWRKIENQGDGHE